jgi:hypothetical protein
VIGNNILVREPANEKQKCVNAQGNARNPKQPPNDAELRETVDQEPVHEYEGRQTNDKGDCGHAPLVLELTEASARRTPKKDINALAI